MAALFPSKKAAAGGQHLWQQANEAHMILPWVLDSTHNQRNQAVARSWRGYENGLKAYLCAFADVARERHADDPTSEWRPSDKWPTDWPASFELPPWVADARFVARHREVLVDRNPNYWGKVAGFEGVEGHHARYLWPCKCGACNDGRVEGISNFCVEGQWRLIENKTFDTTSKVGKTFVSPLVDPVLGSANAALKFDTREELMAAKAALPKPPRKPAARKPAARKPAAKRQRKSK